MCNDAPHREGLEVSLLISTCEAHAFALSVFVSFSLSVFQSFRLSCFLLLFLSFLALSLLFSFFSSLSPDPAFVLVLAFAALSLFVLCSCFFCW